MTVKPTFSIPGMMGRPATRIESVYNAVQRSRGGISAATIAKLEGISRQQARGCLLKLVEWKAVEKRGKYYYRRVA